MRAQVKSGFRKLINSNANQQQGQSRDNILHFDYYSPSSCEVSSNDNTEKSVCEIRRTENSIFNKYNSDDKINTSSSSCSEYYSCESNDVTPTNLPIGYSFDNTMSCDRTSPENTALLIDWDDTIFPSSLLSRLDLDIFSKGASKELSVKYPQIDMKQLDVVTSKFFTLSPNYGMVIIVTNADKGWVELSCKEFLPKTWKVLKENAILIISARYLYANEYPSKPVLWKYKTFLDIFDRMYPSINCKQNLNCVSIGDSESEKLALFNSASHISQNPFAKSLKFIESPTLDALLYQLTYVTERICNIARARGIYDWMITINET